MQSDLSGGEIIQPVIVARGPWISWLAQFYLESLPFAGLVMIDPLKFDATDDVCQFYEKLHAEKKTLSSLEYSQFYEYLNSWDHWTLKLEPGAIPMLVVSTQQQPEIWTRHAQATAERHSAKGSMFGPVSVVEIVETDPSQADKCMEAICEWIDTKIL